MECLVLPAFLCKGWGSFGICIAERVKRTLMSIAFLIAVNLCKWLLVIRHAADASSAGSLKSRSE